MHAVTIVCVIVLGNELYFFAQVLLEIAQMTKCDLQLVIVSTNPFIVFHPFHLITRVKLLLTHLHLAVSLVLTFCRQSLTLSLCLSLFLLSARCYNDLRRSHCSKVSPNCL
jgi:hypothetical protein